MSDERTSVIILGAGGHAKVLIDCLCTQANFNIIGLVEEDPEKIGHSILGVKVIGTESILINYPPHQVSLVNAIGSIDIPHVRKHVYERYKNKNYKFISVIHPTAYVSRTTILNEGIQVMAGAIIQPGCCLGQNTIINTGVTVDHDCVIGDHVHLAPGVVISGNVCIGNESHIGIGANILQNIRLGQKSLVGAGALVIKDVVSGDRVVGIPAKSLKSIKEDCINEGLERNIS